MAAHSVASAYQNFSLNDVFGKPKSCINQQEIQNELAPDFMNECRFAVPTGLDVCSSSFCLNDCQNA